MILMNSNSQQSDIFCTPRVTTITIALCRHGETLAVPLVQALCTFAGGLGLTLLSISSLESRLLSPSTNDSYYMTWILPPGTIKNTQWTISGASRLMIKCMSQISKIMSSWRDNTLALFVPTFSLAAFNLQYGFSKYDEMQD
jgi:hypothetical protein